MSRYSMFNNVFNIYTRYLRLTLITDTEVKFDWSCSQTQIIRFSLLQISHIPIVRMLRGLGGL